MILFKSMLNLVAVICEEHIYFFAFIITIMVIK